ncbi:histone-lysine N-trimethyltransferase SMYD5-like [Saccostrea echinata]|uniref:histone-lysine N-trimethyltransferase SMYD5-like n=1 Tax=Saccostrea echinata TaxID=191078 RepID=UPI002A808E1A|nr:histone-lysine N-trimethyltransferase SMYD5-like [Saccostrea echinata]
MERNLETYIKETKNLVETQNFQKAYEVFTEALKIYPSCSELKDGLRKMQEGVLERITRKPVSPLSTNLKPLPGDDILLRHEEEFVKLWIEDTDIETIDSSLELKDNLATTTEIVDLFTNGETQKGMHKLRSWFASSECDVAVLMKSVYDADLYKECVYICTKVQPQLKSSSIWILGAKAAQKLGLPVTAEHWLRTIFESDDNESESCQEAIQLFLDIRTTRLFHNRNTDIAMNLTGRGRAVTARSDKDDQSIVFVERPVLCAPVIDSSYGDIPACSLCAKCIASPEQFFGLKILKKNKSLKEAVDQFWTIRKPVKCEHCSLEVYCSDECRCQSWEKYHKVICPSQNEHSAKLYKICTEYKNALLQGLENLEGWWYESFSPLLLARLWATILCDAFTEAEKSDRTQITDVDIITAKRKFDSFQVQGRGGITKRIPKMYDLMVKIFSNKDKNSHYNITPEEFNFRYGQIYRNVQAFSDANHPYFEFRKYVDTIPEMQSLKILQNSIREAVFAGLFTLQSSLNHSCSGNVEIISGIVNETPGIHVISRKPIREGEELFVSYVDTSFTRQQRRGFLYRLYHFWCECPRCMFEGDDSDVCTQCGKEADDEKGFPSCGRCHKAWYCSKTCQKTAWKKGHKEICVYR